MISCPWCGINYRDFQPNCDNCGGVLPESDKPLTSVTSTELRAGTPPSLVPRTLPKGYIRQCMGSDVWVITGGVFILLGVIFIPLGLALTLADVTVFVGLPFLLIGLVFIGAAIPLLIMRYTTAKRYAEVMRNGQATLGHIISLEQNYNVRINNKHPWIIAYNFRAYGVDFEGRFTTLDKPRAAYQPGTPVYVLYDSDDPEMSLLYPPV